MDWLKKLELKDALAILALLVAMGAAKSRLEAVEKAVEPVPQLQIDNAVIKASIVTMSMAVKDLADENKVARRRGP